MIGVEVDMPKGRMMSTAEPLGTVEEEDKAEKNEDVEDEELKSANKSKSDIKQSEVNKS